MHLVKNINYVLDKWSPKAVLCCMYTMTCTDNDNDNDKVSDRASYGLFSGSTK